jgi:hypothetical protein
MRWLVLLPFGAVVVACLSADSSSSPYGCCEVGSSPPPQCVMQYGGTKRSADDRCSQGNDGQLPDTSEPGWTKVPDENGCPVWTPPPNVRNVCCGCAPPEVDASSDASDASSD